MHHTSAGTATIGTACANRPATGDPVQRVTSSRTLAATPTAMTMNAIARGADSVDSTRLGRHSHTAKQHRARHRHEDGGLSEQPRPPVRSDMLASSGVGRHPP